MSNGSLLKVLTWIRLAGGRCLSQRVSAMIITWICSPQLATQHQQWFSPEGSHLDNAAGGSAYHRVSTVVFTWICSPRYTRDRWIGWSHNIDGDSHLDAAAGGSAYHTEYQRGFWPECAHLDTQGTGGLAGHATSVVILTWMQVMQVFIAQWKNSKQNLWSDGINRDYLFTLYSYLTILVCFNTNDCVCFFSLPLTELKCLWEFGWKRKCLCYNSCLSKTLYLVCMYSISGWN